MLSGHAKGWSSSAAALQLWQGPDSLQTAQVAFACLDAAHRDPSYRRKTTNPLRCPCLRGLHAVLPEALSEDRAHEA